MIVALYAVTLTALILTWNAERGSGREGNVSWFDGGTKKESNTQVKRQITLGGHVHFDVIVHAIDNVQTLTFISHKDNVHFVHFYFLYICVTKHYSNYAI